METVKISDLNVNNLGGSGVILKGKTMYPKLPRPKGMVLTPENIP